MADTVNADEIVEQLRSRPGEAITRTERLMNDAVAVISFQKQRIDALMAERTSLIDTKREQLASMDQRHLAETAEWRGEFEVLLQEKRDAESRVQSLEEEVKELRGIVSECAAALPNGAFIDASASVEFMGKLPGEIASVCAALKENG